MKRISPAALIPLMVVVALLAASCGETSRNEGTLEIEDDVVSHETTQDILVFAPEREGKWPVVITFHGVGGDATDMAEFDRHLARAGYVVFAPNYRSEVTTEKGINDLVGDVECGYRYARTIAADYGGDLAQPMTFVGWSLGASIALDRAMAGDVTYPNGEPIKCFEEMPRPDAVVGISGCHYEFEGRETGLDMSGWIPGPEPIVLIGGQEDTNCDAWQSEKAAEEMRAAGYEVELEVLRGADHFAPVFHSVVDGTMSVAPDAAAGERAVELVVDAIERAASS